MTTSVMDKPLETDSVGRTPVLEPVVPVKITRRTIDRVLVWTGVIVAVVEVAGFLKRQGLEVRE